MLIRQCKTTFCLSVIVSDGQRARPIMINSDQSVSSSLEQRRGVVSVGFSRQEGAPPRLFIACFTALKEASFR